MNGVIIIIIFLSQLEMVHVSIREALPISQYSGSNILAPSGAESKSSMLVGLLVNLRS